MSALRDAAWSYTEQSPQWPIFPLNARTKVPLINTGTDHAANASTDPAQIQRWLRRWPNKLWRRDIRDPVAAGSGSIPAVAAAWPKRRDMDPRPSAG